MNNKKERNKKAMIKSLLIALGVLMFIWYLAPLAINGILNAGNLLGMVCSAIFVAVVIFWGHIAPLFSASMGAKSVFIKIISTLIACVVVITSVTFCSMFFAQNTKCESNSTVIILGCEVRGNSPSRMLRQRIEVAYDYLKENDGSNAVLSGGQGADEIMTEAECMRRELVKRGIDQNRLFLEEKSTNTKQNITYSAEIIKSKYLSNDVVVVTSDFHEKRALMLCKECGLSASAKSSKTDFYLAGTYWLREILAVIKEFVM